MEAFFFPLGHGSNIGVPNQLIAQEEMEQVFVFHRNPILVYCRVSCMGLASLTLPAGGVI